VFCEPASAASVAGLLEHVRRGGQKPASVVCVLTGNGLKDPERAVALAPRARRGPSRAGCRPCGAPRVTGLRVRVPATSANLGPGFDSFGLALPIVAEFELRAARSWSVSVDGSADGIPVGEDNLFVIAARAAAKAIGSPLPAQHVTQRSAIPQGRGLGSSAAAIVGGAVAANALLGEPLGRRALLRVATEVEGHADNVAAALYGAFTVALPHPDGPIAARLAFPAAWRICLLVPASALATEKARGVLPAQVSRADAVFNLAHAAVARRRGAAGRRCAPADRDAGPSPPAGAAAPRARAR